MLESKCRVCGCTELNACPGGCCWVEEDLCDRCLNKEPFKLPLDVYEALGGGAFFRTIYGNHVNGGYIDRILFSEDRLVILLPPNDSGCLYMVVQPHKECDDCEIAFGNDFNVKLEDAPIFYSGEDIFTIKSLFEHVTGLKVGR